MNPVKLVILFIALTISTHASGIKITVTPATAVIILNDSLVSKGELNTEIIPGRHIIKVKKDMFSWSDNSIEDTIFVNSEEQVIERAYTLPEKRVIKTIPGDAEVYLADSLLGVTPMLLQKSIIGDKLLLKKNGFMQRKIEAGYNFDIPVELSHTFPGQTSQKFTDSHWFYILIGSAAILGATAACLKIEADNNYDEYEKTKNPDFLDKTDRYDLYSGVALGALQINFGVLIYKFLDD